MRFHSITEDVRKMKSYHLLCKRHSSVFRALSKCGIHFSLKCCKSLSATANWKPSQTANLPFLYSSSPPHILRMSLAFSLLNVKTLLPLLHVWWLHLTSQVLIHLDSLHPLAQTSPFRCHLLALSCKSSSFYPCSTVQSGNLLVLFPECPFSLVSVGFFSSSFFPSSFQPQRLP